VVELKCMTFSGRSPRVLRYIPTEGNVHNAPKLRHFAIGPTSCLMNSSGFHPEARQKAIPQSHISPNNELIMDPISYHQYQAVRGRLIDVAHEAETKFQNYDPGYVRILGVLLNFYLPGDDLEDFVALYRADPDLTILLHDDRIQPRGSVLTDH